LSKKGDCLLESEKIIKIKETCEYLSKKHSVEQPKICFNRSLAEGNYYDYQTRTIFFNDNIAEKIISVRELTWIFIHEFAHYLQHSEKSKIDKKDFEYHRNNELFFGLSVGVLGIISCVLNLIYSLKNEYNVTYLIVSYAIIVLIGCRLTDILVYNKKYIEISQKIEYEADNLANEYDGNIAESILTKLESQPNIVEKMIFTLIGTNCLLTHPTIKERIDNSRKFAKTVN
jgi:hypothetical protein